MVEMLLGTDMGNHAKIFSQFRRRLSEASDWYSRKEDVRLALVMAIKMADISNCGRPRDLYLRWAENIATEFYSQPHGFVCKYAFCFCFGSQNQKM